MSLTDGRAIAEAGAAAARAGRDRASSCWPGPPRRSATGSSSPRTCRTRCWSSWPRGPGPGVDVLFLDTGYHFAETIGTRDAVETVYDVRIVNARPEHTRRRAGHAAGQGPVRPRPQPVLRAAQGGAAAEDPGRLRRLGHRRAPGRGPDPGEHPAGHLRREVRAGQGQPARRLDRRGHGRLHRRARHPGQPAGRRGLPEHRLRAVHAEAGAGRRQAQRPLGRHRQDRVRAAQPS